MSRDPRPFISAKVKNSLLGEKKGPTIGCFSKIFEKMCLLQVIEDDCYIRAQIIRRSG